MGQRETARCPENSRKRRNAASKSGIFSHSLRVRFRGNAAFKKPSREEPCSPSVTQPLQSPSRTQRTFCEARNFPGVSLSASAAALTRGPDPFARSAKAARGRGAPAAE
eukprot:scaffold111_cov252-Pinguiococcus_pyrenoidosus.AAC.3